MYYTAVYFYCIFLYIYKIRQTRIWLEYPAVLNNYLCNNLYMFDSHWYMVEGVTFDGPHLLFEGGGGDSDGLRQNTVHPRHDVTELLLWDHAAFRYGLHHLPAVPALYAAHQSWTKEQGCFMRRIDNSSSGACSIVPWTHDHRMFKWSLVQSDLWFNIQSACDGLGSIIQHWCSHNNNSTMGPNPAPLDKTLVYNHQEGHIRYQVWK